jgi:hypothetical protein
MSEPQRAEALDPPVIDRTAHDLAQLQRSAVAARADRAFNHFTRRRSPCFPFPRPPIVTIDESIDIFTDCASCSCFSEAHVPISVTGQLG